MKKYVKVLFAILVLTVMCTSVASAGFFDFLSGDAVRNAAQRIGLQRTDAPQADDGLRTGQENPNKEPGFFANLFSRSEAQPAALRNAAQRGQDEGFWSRLTRGLGLTRDSIPSGKSWIFLLPRTYDESIQVSEINNYFSQNVVSATANPELVGMLDVTLSNGDVLMISNDLKSSFRQTNLAYAEAVFNWIEDQSDGWSVAGYDDITKGGILDQPGIFIEPEIGIDFGLVFTPDIGAEMLTDIINNLDVVGDLGTGIYMDLSFIAVSAGYFDVYSPDVGGVGSGGFSEGSYFGNEHCGGTSGTAMTVNGELVGYNCDVNGDSDKSGETYSVNTDGQDVLIHNDDIDDDGQADGSPGEQIGFDDDNDGDGIPNSDDSYSTGPTDGDDGYVQYDDEGNVVSNYDMDNDGQPAGQDDDNDGDGIPDTEDPDDDNDGVDDQYDEDPKNPYNSDSNEPEEPETDDDDDGDDDDDDDGTDEDDEDGIICPDCPRHEFALSNILNNLQSFLDGLMSINDLANMVITEGISTTTLTSSQLSQVMDQVDAGVDMNDAVSDVLGSMFDVDIASAFNDLGADIGQGLTLADLSDVLNGNLGYRGDVDADGILNRFDMDLDFNQDGVVNQIDMGMLADINSMITDGLDQGLGGMSVNDIMNIMGVNLVDQGDMSFGWNDFDDDDTDSNKKQQETGDSPTHEGMDEPQEGDDDDDDDDDDEDTGTKIADLPPREELFTDLVDQIGQGMTLGQFNLQLQTNLGPNGDHDGDGLLNQFDMDLDFDSDGVVDLDALADVADLADSTMTANPVQRTQMVNNIIV